MNLGFIPHLHVRVVLLVSLLVSGLVAVVLPVAGSAAAPAEPDLVVLAASAPGDSWDADDGGTGAAVLTYGHVGCTAVDAAGVCTGGVWGKVPGASWIWRLQSADNTKPQATFAKTFEVAVNQTAEPAVLNIAADNVFSVVLNGVEVASGSTFTQGTNFAVPLKAGSNTISISVTNLLNGQGSYNNPAGLAWAIRAVKPADNPPPTTPYQPPIADAGSDQSVPEGSTVTLDGSGSRASTKPSLQASQQQGSLPGGTSLGSAIAGLDPDAPGLRVEGSVDIGQGPAAQNTSIAYVLDVSGSAGDRTGCGGDVNGDRSANTILDCEIAAAIKLHEEVSAAGTVDKVAVVRFNTGASALDLDPTAATATLVSPKADKDNDGTPDVVEGLKSLRVGGGTNFVPAARTACQLLATTGSPNLISAFLSDGQQNSSLTSVVPCSPPVTFHAFAVGSGSKCASGAPVGARLLDLATRSGGTCTDVPTVTELPEILPQVVASRITAVSYTVDGGDPVDMTEQLALPKDGPADLDVVFDLPQALATGTHRICLTVTGQDSGGSSSQTACSDLVTVSGEVAYSWRVASRQGPPIFLSSRTSADPSFVAADDGRYVLELTVSDGTGSTASDEVVVDITNVDPAVELSPGDAFAGGVTQVNATLTDEGWLDTHTATVSWGDGTTDEVDVTTSGPGWGSFFGSHVYRQPGSFDVVVTLADDDGGVSTARVDHLEVASPVAVWANAEGAPSLDWAGGSGEIQGRVHTNGQLRFVGASKTVKGPSTFAGALAADTTKNSFTPLPLRAPVQDFPIHPRVADFRPGGPVATEVGSAYHDMSSACAAGTWHEVQQSLDSGVYYASCDIQLNGSDIGGRVTLVSEGRIKVAGSRPAFEPYRDGLLLLAGSSDRKAIDISTSSSKFLGVLFAGSGQISISGASNRFFCGILGDTVSVTGTDVTVRGADCGRPASTVSAPIVVPDLAASLTVDRETALPSDEIGYDVTVTNRGITLVVPSLIGLENVDTSTATVDGYDFTVERQEAATGRWVPFASASDPTMRVDLMANPFPGVAYPAGGEVAGTVVAPGGWASWGLQSVLSLTPEQATELLDPSRTSGVRSRVDFTLSPSGIQARRLYTYGTDFAAQLRALGADAADIDVTTVLPDGEASVERVLDADQDAVIAPGGSATLHRTYSVPVPAPRTASESDAGYLNRLLSQDGTELSGAAYAVGRGGVGRLVVPLERVVTTHQLPVVGLSTSGADAIPAGSSHDYELRLANLGSVDASSLDVKATADSSPLPVTGAPAALAAGELATAHTTYAAPAGSSGSLTLRGTAAWHDARGNQYGLTGSDLAVTRQLPADLSASLVDELVADVHGDGAVSPGDSVRYTVTVRNGGGLPLTGVHGAVPLPAGASLLPGSGATPDGGTVSSGADEVTFSLPDVAASSSRRIRFDVVVATPFPEGMTRLESQGTVHAAGLDPALTDDPALPGAADPTRTTVTRPTPALVASLAGRLAVDGDGSGGVSPGDTLAYALSVSSVGTQQVTGINVSVPAPAGTSLVAGSVTAAQGTVGAGPDVAVNVGTLAPFQETAVAFRLKVADPLPAGVTTITTRGTVTSDQLDPIVTDDPQTATVGDGTTIPIGGGGGDPEIPGATVSQLSLDEGTIVTQPVQVTATLSPAAGTTITSWTVDYRLPGDATTTVLGGGTGTSVDVELDPTKMANGAYVVTIRVTSSNGGTSARETTVVVDGEMKLGRFTTTFNDLTVDMGGIPISVERSYDSFDKSVGDFGYGWSMGFANFRVSTNGPLGRGGWIMQGCGSGLIFVPLCFTSSKAHFVTVTWPDGNNEVFDLTPAQGSTFFKGLTSAKFTGREGSTSKLTAVDSDLFYVNGDLNGGAFGGGGVYDPTRFVLTDRSGTKYTLEVGRGLTKVEDVSGQVLTLTANGIDSNRGPDVIVDRDVQGRITRITDPAGKSILYGYDAAGDLVSVTDRDGMLLELDYDPGHLLRTTNPAGRPPLRTMHYDADGRLSAITDGAGNTVSVSVDPGARVESVTGPDPRLTTISSYDADGNLAKVDRVFGGRTLTSSFTYDELGLVETSTDPLGHTSVAEYDAKGNLTWLEDRDGVVTNLTYNDRGQPLEQRIDGELKTKITYDAATGEPARFDYGSSGDFAEFDYDAAGRLVESRDVAGRTQTMTYGSGHQPLTTSGPDGTTHATYDALGNLATVTDAEGNTLEYTHDDVGQLTAFTDAKGHTTRYRYDAYRRLVEVTDALGKVTSYTYDAAGRVKTRTDRNGVVTTLSYTADGEVKRRETSDGGFEAFEYDAAGRMVSADNGLATLTWAWDDAGRPVRESLDMPGLPQVSVDRGWTPAGQLAEIVDPHGTTSYAYDGQGRLREVSDTQAGAATLAFDSLDRLTKLTRPNGLVTTWDYLDGQIAEQRTSLGDDLVQSIVTERNAAGQPTAVVDATGRHTYEHDGLGQVTAVDHPADSGVADESYSYDAAGNRSSWAGNPAASVTYDDANRLRSDGRWTYRYDDEGRLLSRTSRSTGEITTFEWNSFGQLLRVTPGSGSAITYSYDALGRRIETAVGGDISRTVFAGDNPLLRFDGSTLSTRFDNGLGPDGTLAVTQGSTTTYPLADASGTVSALTDSSGQVTQRFAFDSFGNPAAAQSQTPSDAFHGFEVDPIGMYDARARTYDPSTGRFLSEDPLPAENLYPYAVNSPTRVSDPYGLSVMAEYGATTSNSGRNALAMCTHGSFWSSFLMDTAVEIGLAAALSGTGGIYAFYDVDAKKPYVGRSVDLMRRLNEHLAAGRITNKSQVKVILDVATDMLPKVEQLAIERCNGGRIVKGGANELANKINAINKSRGDELHRTKATLEGLLGR